MHENLIRIYCKGACDGRQGAGGWGVYLEIPGAAPVEAYGSAPWFSDMQMALLAAIEGLSRTPPKARVELQAANQVVIRGMTEYLPRWLQNNWRGANGPVKNKDLWVKLDALARARQVTWVWVKARDATEGHLRADALAARGVRLAETQGGFTLPESRTACEATPEAAPSPSVTVPPPPVGPQPPVEMSPMPAGEPHAFTLMLRQEEVLLNLQEALWCMFRRKGLPCKVVAQQIQVKKKHLKRWLEDPADMPVGILIRLLSVLDPEQLGALQLTKTATP